jgi:hypothetical protein
MLEVMSDEKLAKLVRMLSSSNDAEVLASARALQRTLSAEGRDIHDLADRVSGKISEIEKQQIERDAFRRGQNAAVPDFQSVEGPSFHEMAVAIKQKDNGRLKPHEAQFIDDMIVWCAKRQPTEKQGKWLLVLYSRIAKR